MIDLTPLDVRNKRGDFKRLMRGYDPQEVDVFLELVAERLEQLVRENIQLKERTVTLVKQVESQAGREQAVQDALVTAQALRADIQTQSKREADHVLREAEAEARRILAEAESQVRAKLSGIERRFEGALDGLSELERRRQRFLKEFKSLLQRELDVVGVEEERKPLEDRTIDLDLGSWWSSSGRLLDDPRGEEPSPAAGPPPDEPGATGPSSGTGAGPGAPQAQGAPSALETPSFAKRKRSPGREESPDDPYDDLAAAVEAEARAQAGSEVVEVRASEVESLDEVPRLEQLLAEAGPELVEVKSEVLRRAEKIEPPRPGEGSGASS